MATPSDSAHVIKAVQIALGPDAKCDPYPIRKYEDGADLFTKKYADEFYATYPDLAGIPFSNLKKNHSRNPVVQQVVKEFSEENKKYMAVVKEWEAKWPEDAARVEEARHRSSAQRRERKKRQSTHASAQNYKHAKMGDALPWLTKEFVREHMGFIKQQRAVALKMLYTSDLLMEAFEEHRDFIHDLERDREDVF